MKRIFASSIWTRVILVLAILFIVWSITLIVSVKQRQADLAHEVGLISKLNGVAQSIFALEKSLSAAGPDYAARWRTLYNDYRRRRAEFDPGDPNFRDLQVNLIRTDSLLIHIDRLHADFRRAGADRVLQKSLEADFHREINAAATEVQSAVQTIWARTGQISALLAENWNTLFVLMLVACGLAILVTLLVRLLQKEMAKIKEADAALRQSEERLRKTFEHAPIGIVTSTPEGKFIQLNQAFCELVGYTELELVRLSLADISHPDDLATHEGLMNRLLNREISHYQMEKRYRTKKGQIVYTLLQGSLVRDADGTPLHFIEQIVDMTERIMAEIGRRQSDERFRELAENIQEVFWLTDPAKNEMLYVSPAYEKVWGRPCRSLYDSPQIWFDAIHPDDRERVHRAALSRQVIGQYDETYRILRPDGESRWIRDRAFPIRDELGSVYRLAGLAEDITERKNFNAALQESEQRWNFALEGSDAGVWDWDAQTNRVFYSKRWKEMLGYPEHEIGDSLDESYSRIHPEDLKTAVGALEKHLRGEVPVYISEHRVRCKDGSYKWILDRGKVITRTPEGKPWRVVGTHTDMTERKQAAEELNVTYSRLTTFIENLQSGILFEDKERRVVYMNQMFCDMFGIPVAPSACVDMDCRLTAEQSQNLFIEKEEFVPRVEEILAGRKLVTNEELRLHDGRVFERDYIPIFAEQEYAGHLWHYRDITSIKQAAEETRKSEEQFRLTFEMAPIGMTISGVDGAFLQCNRAFCEMLGYTPEELQGKTWVEVTHPNDVSTNIAFRERLLRGELPNFQMQKRYLARDGRAVHALLQMTLIKDERGRPLHFISQSVNLTALKQTQEELSKQSAILQSIVDSMADGVVVADMNGKFLLFNPAAESIIGLGATETGPQDWADKYGLYLADQITHFPLEQNPMARAMQGETAPAVDMFVRNPQRPRGVWLSVTGTPLKDETGASIGGVVVLRDVTVQKQAEDLLRKNEEQFRLTFEHAPIGMALSSIDGAILQVNQAYCDILGRTPEELVNRSVIEFTHPEDSTENLDLTRQLLRGEIPHYQMEKRYLAKDGHTVYAILTASVVRDRDGHPLHFIGQIADITERKLAEEELQKRTDELQEAHNSLNSVIDNLPAMLFMKDANELRFTRFNRAGEEIIGLKQEDMLGRNDYDFFPKAQADFFTAKDRTVLSNQGVVDIQEEPIQTPWGTKYLHTRKVPIFGADSRPKFLLGISEDITERKAAEEEVLKLNAELEQRVIARTRELQESEERFRQLAENINEVFWVDSADLQQTLYMSPAYENIWGRSRDTVYARADAWIDDIHEEDRERVRTAFNKLHTETYDVEFRLLRPEATMRWIRDRAFPVRNESGEVLRVVGISEDITQRKLAAEALRQSEERFRALYDDNPSIYFMVDANGVILSVNQFGAEELGYDTAELVGEPMTKIFAEEDRTKARQHVNTCLKSPGRSFTWELRMLRKNDSKLWVREYSRAAQDNAGNPVVYIVCEDITSRRQAEMMMQASEARLRKQNESLGDLVRGKTFQSGNLQEALQAVTEAAARCMEVERVSVWFYDEARTKIICRDLFELSRHQHSAGVELAQKDFLPYFEALSEGRDIDAHDAQNDYRTRCFRDSYLRPQGITSMLDAPIRLRGELVGVVCHEHVGIQRQWTLDEQVFAGSLADLVAQALEAHERQRVEEALRDSEERYRTLVEQMPDGIYRSTPDGRFVEVNPAMYQMFGYASKEEFLALDIPTQLYFSPDERNGAIHQLKEIGSEGITIMRQRHKDGHEMWVEDHGRFVYDDGGNILYNEGILRDITARKKAEEALQESETRFRTLIETMNDGLVQLDEKGLLVYVNDKMCEMTGFSREQLLGREVLPRLDTESRDILHEQIERRQTGESKPYEMEVRKKGGGKFPALISPRPIFGLDGRFRGSFAVVTDISERKRMEEQIRRHAEELEQLVEARAERIRLLEQQRAESEKLAATGRMSARIAHEINNPLAGIKNSFLLVKDGIPTTHRYYDYVRRIETEIERIARIVRQMFDLYRPQQDSVRSFPADIAIRDVVALLRTNCRERDVNIDVDINAPALNVALAESSLRQVLYNVIQNAVDASAPGSTVRVRAFSERQKLTINVIDQGQGIPEEIRTKIFEPFFTTKSGLERSGLGLGLSVSKGLVEAMGGKLDFESAVGKGTTFAIVLPLDGASGKPAQH